MQTNSHRPRISTGLIGAILVLGPVLIALALLIALARPADKAIMGSYGVQQARAA